MRRSFALMVLALLTLSCDVGMGSFSGPTACDDLDCAWDVEQGSLERIGTWNEQDYAFSFVGTPTRLGRALSISENPECINFSYVGDVDDSALIGLELDFGDDGSIEVSTPLPTGHWKRQNILVRAPADYRKLRVHLQKSGPGTAKLYEFSTGPGTSCDAMPPVVLQNGAACALDSTCASSRCVLGVCAACGAGGCAEGESCRTDSECSDGACAGAICRACAKRGSCGAGERCSAESQCESKSCSLSALPSMTSHPQLDGTCGECNQASDCATSTAGKECVLGRCAECSTDSDCSDGRACRYLDLFDAQNRACVPKLTSQVPRGALCENDSDCAGGLRCGAGAGRAKRCGFACSAGECAADELCIVPGAKSVGSVPESFELLASYSDLTARIATCYATVARGQPCELAQQCTPAALTSSCCYGRCGVGGSDLATGECLTRGSAL